MSDLQDLYQEMILDHYKHPRNCRRLDGCTCSADGNNPLCGDRIKVFVKVRDGLIEDVGFEGAGCAISTASASIMTEMVKGKPVEQAHKIFRRFHNLIVGTTDAARSGAANDGSGDDHRPADGDAAADTHSMADGDVDLGKLEVFAGVSQYPTRVKCAMLAWHTLEAALQGRQETVSTE